ncbi:phosphatase PAP2 family protein [Altererythrobacter soli]|uniref:Phosphatase PAP2 family protein n=1 Tax=Croceibacterium soli TaxID=1739690 RepID=A0A6I4UUU5_9SPHN|nr:phosphatase PAP2 family protein [Croceibacterium soli]MXP40865.1 phosphatase PAP2 family protein [Croceibacterium soli]
MTLPQQTVNLPSRGWRIDPRKALAVSALCWAGFAILVVLVVTDNGRGFDQTGLMFWRYGDGLEPRGPEWLLEAVRDVTALGGVLLRNLVALGAVAALLFLRLRREAVLMVLTVAGAWLVGYGIKLLVGRERPEIVPHLTDAGGASFPSGHSFNAAVVYIAIALAFATMSSRQSVRFTVIGAAVILSMAIAWSRVWLGVHFPSDVAAGWLGGAGWAFMAAALLRRPADRTADAAEPQLDKVSPKESDSPMPAGPR